MSESEIIGEMEDIEDVNPESHNRLIKAINKLDKTQHIKKPTREELSELKSEFHISKSKSSGNTVAVNDIISILQSTSEHAETGKQIKRAQTLSKTLRKPIEKHEAEKIKRLTGFEETQNVLGKWDAIVTRNRTVEQQKFPLETEKYKPPVTKEYLAKFTLKSDLEIELEKINPTEEEIEEETFPMSMGEMIEHRKEAARLRAKQSYKEAKARRQSKIKSKKFHRVLRKEKIKQQLKEFELLQKNDPEEALKRLEQLEKTRAQERVTLRHKSTGQWAKNKLVRAKYDKETRQQLAEQLAISRELTQKRNMPDETESEEEMETINTNIVTDTSNPWLQNIEPSDDVNEFVTGYKKYWEQRNKTQRINSDDEDEKSETENAFIDNTKESHTKIVSKSNIKTKTELPTKPINNSIDFAVDDEKSKTENVSINNTKKSNRNKKLVSKTVSKRKSKVLSEPTSVGSTMEWSVENVLDKSIPKKHKMVDESERSIDHIFDDLEWKIQKKVSEKLHSFNTDDPKAEISRENKMRDNKYDMKGLEFKQKNIRPVIDEELNENTYKNNDKQNNVPFNIDKAAKGTVQMEVNSSQTSNKIDPEKFVAIKPRHLLSQLPDPDNEGDHLDDDDDEDERKITIAEAFEDDDIVAEFQQEKENEINKNMPKVEDSSLPGWGSWVGKNMKAPRKSKRRFFNAPKVIPRKDDKKTNVIINEAKDSKLRSHQVSELPFPFTSVSEFESTMRAPIGNTFVPETAFRKLIKPAVVVKTGVVIDPMDESQLVNQKNKNKQVSLKIIN